MGRLDPLFAAVCATPEDLTPRRVYAEAVKPSDPERARLIELQLARRAGQDPSPGAARELVQRHGAAWAGALAQVVDDFMFWGGFVEEIELDAPKLCSRAWRRHETSMRAG